MYQSRNKIDLIVEVWEKLDCESVGAAEIRAIEKAVRNRFGNSAVDSPMAIARLLADEGAALRHAEILELFVERSAETIYDAALKNIVDISSLEAAANSIRQMENLRAKFAADEDKEGLRLLREKAILFKERAHELSLRAKASRRNRLMYAEIAEWLTIWLRTPEIFDSWLSLRRRSTEFRSWFEADGSTAQKES